MPLQQPVYSEINHAATDGDAGGAVGGRAVDAGGADGGAFISLLHGVVCLDGVVGLAAGGAEQRQRDVRLHQSQNSCALDARSKHPTASFYAISY